MNKNEQPFLIYLIDLIVKLCIIMFLVTATFNINRYIEQTRYEQTDNPKIMFDTRTGKHVRILRDTRNDDY